MLNLQQEDLIAGINAARISQWKKNLLNFPKETAIGSMAHYITTTNAKNFQPMNANFGLFPELTCKELKGKRNEMNSMQNEHWKQFRNL